MNWDSRSSPLVIKLCQACGSPCKYPNTFFTGVQKVGGDEFPGTSVLDWDRLHSHRLVLSRH